MLCKKFVLRIQLCFLLFQFLPALIIAQVVTRGAYLQQVTPTSIVIQWRTDLPTNSRVEYGTTPSCLLSVIKTETVLDHKIYLNSLTPGTKYFYRIGSSSQILQSGSANFFRTAPPKNSSAPVRIWVTGDFGNGSTQQAAVRDAYNNFTTGIHTDFWIWLGDNAYYSGTDQQYGAFVFDMYPDELKHFPLYPSPGNHDYGQVGYHSNAALSLNFPYFSIFTVPQYGEAGGYPSGTPKYYSYNYSNIHCISLDSYGTPNDPGSPMYKWLAKDLSLNHQRWTIVYFHHPPFSKGSHNSDIEIELVDMRTHIVPLLETFDVDLVLSGHSHSNERSYLIKGHYGFSYTFDSTMKKSNSTHEFIKQVPYEGTIYAVCGTSGQLAASSQPDAPMPCMFFNDFNSNCSMIIDVNNDLLTAKYLSATGQIMDEFSIHKPGPNSDINAGDASCEISYHPVNNTFYFSLYLTEPVSFSASLYNLQGQLIAKLENDSAILSAGYHVESSVMNKSGRANGIYIIKAIVGNQSFTRKVAIWSN